MSINVHRAGWLAIDHSTLLIMTLQLSFIITVRHS